ncbi:MAG: putative ATPase [Mycobacterium sp.]|nr:putative ATPase [Mycobacterium sp.]
MRSTNGGMDGTATSSGIVTFLFTDIEGSTRRWEADAGAMRAALVAHDAVLRAAIIDCGGSLFKHTGDGVCAAFSSPRVAVDAAIAAQRVLELPVRMGIATGEAETRDGDYFGITLNRGARVMAAGHGGQILLDGLTADLLGDVDLLDLGSHRMRDIAKPVQLFQVRAPGVRDEFPPLKTVDPAPGNLRLPPTRLIGREVDVAAVAEALRSHRLVTLIGVGGVGKTRLALEVASCVAADFPDGGWLVELAAITDPAAVPEAVAAVLGITQQSGLSLADSVATALDGRHRLLVFDNCEHVLDAAADMVEAILAASKTVRVLATSREGLRLPDEQLRPVPPLEVSPSASTLFVERAQAVAPAISLVTEMEAVTEICRRLDGIPLAIELAASRMQSMTVLELRERLDDRFHLLVGSRRGLERHQTLRHAVQWSYDLLDDAEASVLRRCSVFTGGFDLAAACAVSGNGDEYAVVDLLDSLVRKSLVVAGRASGRTRFSMLETIRQFAEDQLTYSGAADETRAIHARFFAIRSSDMLDVWDGPRQRETYDWLTAELPNLRAAFRWAADRGELDTSAAIAFSAGYLGFWIEQVEPIGWAEELLPLAIAVLHPRLAQLYAISAYCFVAGRAEASVLFCDAAETAVDSGRFEPIPYEFEAWLGGAYLAVGKPAGWVARCRNIIGRGGGDHIRTRSALVLALTICGEHDEALAISESLIASVDTADNPQLACILLLASGMGYRNTNPAAAYGILQRGLELATSSGNSWAESHLSATLARLAAGLEDWVAAFDLLALAIRKFHDSGSFSLMSSPLAILARALDRLGHYEPAAKINAFASNPWTVSANAELEATRSHLREVLGDIDYVAFSRFGEGMTNAGMATYALEQLGLARAELS